MLRSRSGHLLPTRRSTRCGPFRSLGLGLLEPDFDPVSVEISGEQIGFSWDELRALENRTPRLPNGFRGSLDLFRIHETEPEMGDAFHLADLPPVLLEHDHVVATGSLRLNHSGFAVRRSDAQNLLVELEGTVRIGDGQPDVRQPIGPDHGDTVETNPYPILKTARRTRLRGRHHSTVK